MLRVDPSTKFGRDLKIAKKRGWDIELIKQVIILLAAESMLPENFHDHALSGNWSGFRECHIRPDWLLIYKVNKDKLHLVRTGTHSDLF
ncbi:MAG: type II toxin-antitoxin system YafQ family toxin [Opitutae bacterium]|nr:type II toxin-antitoxin system YafQ family toxin [Opitutae bacterium]